MAYSLAQMQSLLRQAGWPENRIVTMAAIGMAESSGLACNVGTIAPGEYSVGLWQVNLDPKLKRPWTKQQLCDPLFNAKVALQIYGQQGLRAWGSYTDGRYRRYIPESQTVYAPNATTVPGTNNLTDYQDTPVNESINTGTKILIGSATVVVLLLLLK